MTDKKGYIKTTSSLLSARFSMELMKEEAKSYLTLASLTSGLYEPIALDLCLSIYFYECFSKYFGKYL